MATRKLVSASERSGFALLSVPYKGGERGVLNAAI